MAREKTKKKPGPVRHVDPDADWNSTANDPAEALAQCARIRGKIEAAPEAVAERAAEYFGGVLSKLAAVEKVLRVAGRMTDAQARNLLAWETGVDKWLVPRKGADEDGLR